MSLPKIIALVGSTASGKTDCALRFAKDIGGEIICADSRTIYTGMTIGTAKPQGERRFASEVRQEDIEGMGIHGSLPSISITDLFEEKPLLVEGVPHWGIDLIEPSVAFSAVDFKNYAERKIEEIIARGAVPILVGGTGLYVQAVVENLQFTAPEPDVAKREELEALSQDVLLERLRRVDPGAEAYVDVENRRRLVRAIEVVELSGKPFLETQAKGEKKYDVLLLGLDVPREVLYERIEERVDRMIAEGLVDEVRELYGRFGSTAPGMNGIGYRQICLFLEGYIKLRDAIDLVKRDSRQYAKRQMTWFKRMDGLRWVRGCEEATEAVREFLSE